MLTRSFPVHGRWLVIALSALGLGVGTYLPSSLQAQGFGGGTCNPVSWNRQDTRDFGTGAITWFSQVTIACTDGTRIQTDSAVVFDATGQYELVGRVRMQGPSRNLNGDRVDYNARSGILFARGAVTFTDPAQGTVIEGDTLHYVTAGDGRPDDQILVTGRQARATFPPGGAGGASAGGGAAVPPIPYVVTANNMRFEGERFFFANGEVEVVRDSLHATADSLVFDQTTGGISLAGESSLESSGLLFLGDRMNLDLPDDELRGVVVTGNSRMETEEMTLVGGEIRVTLEEGKIQRILSVQRPGEDEGTPRPYVVAEEVFLMSDSIDVRTPGEVLEMIYAVGTSWSERRAPGDSLPDLFAGSPSGRAIDPANPPSRDWIEGNEIEIAFSPITDPEQDGYEISYLYAVGTAGSFYRSTGGGMGGRAPAEGTAGQRVFDYIRADQIRMTFQNGEAVHVEAVGKAVGVHVELPPLPTAYSETDETR